MTRDRSGTDRRAAVRRIGLSVLVACTVVYADIASKAIVDAHVPVGGSTRLISGLLALGNVRHQGAGGTVADEVMALAIVPIAVWVEVLNRLLVPPRRRVQLACATGIGLGGAAGNALERLRHGYVTDWVVVHLPRGHWAALNVSDVCIAVSLASLAAIIALVAIDVGWRHADAREGPAAPGSR